MLYLTIGPKHEAANAKLKYNCDYVISIQDVEDETNDKVPTPFGVDPEKHIHLFFDDLSDEYPIRKSSRYPEVVRDRLPEKEHVTKVLEFTSKIPDWSKVYVHCFAGVSRSTAMAYAILCARDVSADEAGCMMLVENSAIHGGIWPNQRIVRLADEFLERGGKMNQALMEWKAAEKAVAGDVDAWIARLKEKSEAGAAELEKLRNPAVLWDVQQESLAIDKPKDLS